MGALGFDRLNREFFLPLTKAGDILRHGRVGLPQTSARHPPPGRRMRQTALPRQQSTTNVASPILSVTSLRVDFGEPHIITPGLFILDEQRLGGVGRRDKRVAAELVEELARVVHREDLIEPRVDPIDGRARRRARQDHRPP